ncbi:Rv1733c family protein [Nocardia mexicana]
MRAWRSVPWSRNPLMRTSDRLLAAITLFALVCCVIAVPIACAVGTAHYGAAARRMSSEKATRSIVTATVMADARYARSAQRAEAALQWRWDSRVRSTKVARVPVDAVRGDRIGIWVDKNNGAIADAPSSSMAAAWSGVGSALTVLVVVCLGAAGVIEFARWLVSRRRAAQWDTAWIRNEESGP